MKDHPIADEPYWNSSAISHVPVTNDPDPTQKHKDSMDTETPQSGAQTPIHNLSSQDTTQPNTPSRYREYHELDNRDAMRQHLNTQRVLSANAARNPVQLAISQESRKLVKEVYTELCFTLEGVQIVVYFHPNFDVLSQTFAAVAGHWLITPDQPDVWATVSSPTYDIGWLRYLQITIHVSTTDDRPHPSALFPVLKWFLKTKTIQACTIRFTYDLNSTSENRFIVRIVRTEPGLPPGPTELSSRKRIGLPIIGALLADGALKCRDEFSVFRVIDSKQLMSDFEDNSREKLEALCHEATRRSRHLSRNGDIESCISWVIERLDNPGLVPFSEETSWSPPWGICGESYGMGEATVPLV
ncbi:hypothetical protein C8A00DRAFT_37781 [Chaetomidium leptoderma]|uniref:Uncharacterized protein n=1 Tax=Chaetomidium leptoderma TaxID=669021 RepID=A0AAN6VGA4_9PEZI|nr:hypothetical protein C8A00DRAFT_37781 [Chaetomidium leptoderma]